MAFEQVKSADYRYFLYSTQQQKDRTNIEKKIGKEFISGTVIVNGKRERFTELSKKSENIRYSDSKIMAEGDINNMKYTMPISKSQRKN